MMTPATTLFERSARHRFRATIPVYPDPKPVRDTLSDRQLFVMTFIAGFMAFYGFLA
ncbi:hypothetical protein BH09PSE3_BH09PSE3_22290 [soil metagenome]